MAVETHGPTVTAVALTFAVVSFITIVLRLWSRIFVVKTFGTDDGVYSKQLFGPLLQLLTSHVVQD